MGTGERHLHLLHPFLYPLDANQERISTGAPAHGEGNAKGFTPSAESYPKNEEARTAPRTSLEGKSRFAGAELWVVFLQTGSQSKWGFPMCLITEPAQTGFRCLPAKLSPADNKLPRALGEAPAHRESWLPHQDSSQPAAWSFPLSFAFSGTGASLFSLLFTGFWEPVD